MRTNFTVTLFMAVVFLLLPGSAIYAMDISILGLFSDRAILKVDDRQHILKTGQTSPEGIKLVSSDSQYAVLEINGKQEKYALGSHVSSHFDKPEIKGQAMIWPVNGMYVVAGSINGYPIKFMVDTGASWVSMNSEQAKRLGIDYRVKGRRDWVSTANGTVPIFIVNLDKVKIGDIEFSHVEAGVLEGHSPSEVLLGMSFLERVEIERKGTMMLLKRKW
ncbi:MAG: retroviral-like aspartic protease family protein [Gammaproteobacteria bacterium]|nr:retroviral-like aspartic protease family protein [Gammaproteobacteria bacterium]